LLQQGFTLLWSAWTWDVIADVQEKRLIFEPPIATLSGNPITGEVAYELLVDRPAQIAEFTGIQGAAYGFAEDGVRDAVLTVRERPEGPRRVTARMMPLNSCIDVFLPMRIPITLSGDKR